MEEKTFHVFIIPDGNRRWAKEKGLAPHEGHRQGREVFRNIAKNIWSLGVSHFTFWGLSRDNFQKRSKHEMAILARLAEQVINEFLESLEYGEKTRIQVVGRWKEIFDYQLVNKIQQLENKTASYEDRNLTILLGYNGDDELEEAITSLHQHTAAAKRISWNLIRLHLWTGFLPDVDIFIRTGFEPHLSAAALCMQMANACLYFPQMHWPDFSLKELAKIIDDFKNRQRRFGA